MAMQVRVHVPPKLIVQRSVHHQPLSLQQTCILYVVTNLELFPPDLLALLPLKFRRELLLLLPPADIFQLEQTSVVDGIDMENEVWKVVFERCNFSTSHSFGLRHPLPMDIRSHLRKIDVPVTSWKAKLTSFIISFLLHMEPFPINFELSHLLCDFNSSCNHRNYILFLQLLFTTQFVRLNIVSEAKGFPLKVFDKQVVLPRFAPYYSEAKQLELSDWVQFLLRKCHLPPPNHISVEERFFTLLKNHSLKHLIQPLLQQVESINFHLFYDISSSRKMPGSRQLDHTNCMVMSLFDLILSGNQTSIKNIQISNYVEKQQGSHQRGSHQRGSHWKSNCYFKDALKQLFLLPSEPLVCHFSKSLQDVQINGKAIHIDMSTLCALLLLLKNIALKNLDVSGSRIIFNTIDEREHLACVQKLRGESTRLIISPNCTSIKLYELQGLPLSVFYWLLQIFLYSPCSGPQKLTVSQCSWSDDVFCTEANLFKHVTLPPSCLEPPHKSLHLSHLTITTVLLKIMSCLPSVVLDSLELEGLNSETDNITPVDFVSSFFTKSVIRIKALTYDLVLGSNGLRILAPCREFYLYLMRIENMEAVFTTLKLLAPFTAVTLKYTISRFGEAPFPEYGFTLAPLLTNLVKQWEKNCVEGIKLSKLIIVYKHSFMHYRDQQKEESVAKHSTLCNLANSVEFSCQ